MQIHNRRREKEKIKDDATESMANGRHVMTQADNMCESMERIIANVESNPPWRKETEDEWKIEMVVDSGATDSVGPLNMIPNKKPQKGKKFGMQYNCANGHKVVNEGIIKMDGKTANQEPFSAIVQAADITKPLASTIDMVDADNFVCMTKTGGTAKKLSKEDVEKIMKIIQDAPGAAIPFSRKGRKFVMEVTIPKDPRSWNNPKNPVKNRWQDHKGGIKLKNRFDGANDDMDVDGLFIGQAIRR